MKSTIENIHKGLIDIKSENILNFVERHTVFCFGLAAGICLKVLQVRSQLQKAQARNQLNNAAAAQKITETYKGMLTSSAIYVGDVLGLYEHFYEHGPITCEALAASKKLNERWLREWLMQGASSGILGYNSKTNEFHLKNEFAPFLLDSSHPAGTCSMAGMFSIVPAMVSRITMLPKTCLLDGVGDPYDGTYNEEIAVGLERANLFVNRDHFINAVLPYKGVLGGKLPDMMRKGIKCAEIGCGTGTAMVQIAKTFPNSSVHGYELSKVAIQKAAERIKSSTLRNVSIIDASQTPSTPSYEFVYCLDVVHDVSDPEALLRGIFKILKPGGVFIALDIACDETAEEKINHPRSEIRYGLSLGICLHSSCTKEGGAALGTLGLNIKLFTALLHRVGFSSVTPFCVSEIDGSRCFAAVKPN